MNTFNFDFKVESLSGRYILVDTTAVLKYYAQSM